MNTKIYQIAITPIQDNGSIDLNAFNHMVSNSLENGIDTLTLNGVVSEYEFLTQKQIDTILSEASKSFSEQQDRFLVGVSGAGESVVEEIRQYAEHGFTRFMIHPYASMFVPSDGWLRSMLECVQTFPEYSFVPYVKNESLLPGDASRLFAEAENVEAVKYSQKGANRAQFLKDCTVEYGHKIIDGLTESSFHTTRFHNFAGYTSGLANVFPKLSRAFADLGEAGGAASLTPVQAALDFERIRGIGQAGWSIYVIKYAMQRLYDTPDAMILPGSRGGESLKKIVDQYVDTYASEWV